MKKFLLFAAAIMAAAMLSAPEAFATMSPTEPDRPITEVGEPDTPSTFVPAPQTGETGAGGSEVLTLAAAASTVCGAVVLARTKKQADSLR